ncbi:MAG: sigma-54-dependent Fis family transcriptional regulator [Oscillospiraceae bacterium]|nr:sigma-54-dependent Fis family transcriptional regulator [Oscillospiraceae bacterium]
MDLAEMTELWAQYVFEDKLSPKIRTPIAESWKKCKAAGINPTGGKGRHIDDKVLASAREEHRVFLDVAVPVMREMFGLINSTQFLIVLTDSAGYLLEILGPPEIIARCNDMRFVPGAMWSNLEVGTNAISVALDYDMAIQMVGPEHYCISHHTWTCSASPIHNPNGEIVGCINLSGDYKDVHPHTLALVQEAARNIEAQIRHTYNSEMMLSLLNSSDDSMLLLDSSLEPVWMNEAAETLLKTDLDGLKTMGIKSFFPYDMLNIERRLKDEKSFRSDNIALLIDGEARYCSMAAAPLTYYGYRTIAVTLRMQKHLINAANRISGNRAVYTFRDCYTANETMKKTLSYASTFARYEGNILIQGESGTGKELLAQAIHNAGKNADGPFVAVNCASIPRELFDMELFGYEMNAFPGKVDEGKPGRFELAQNGTLFLDEVSSMPLEMQIKLLRAVETHCVQRLGSTREIQLNIRIISSSNQDLEQLVEHGAFRKDMYFRLSTLKLEIPPLRERPEDIALFAGRFLQTLNENSLSPPKTMSEEFLNGLREYDWPGNIRELQNMLARAYYTSESAVLSAGDLSFSLKRPETTERPAQTKGDSGEGAIMAALTICRGDVQAAADRLGLSRATLYRRLKEYGIDPKKLKT